MFNATQKGKRAMSYSLAVTETLIALSPVEVSQRVMRLAISPQCLSVHRVECRVFSSTQRLSVQRPRHQRQPVACGIFQ
jgi:hypothetical protein